MNYPLFYHGRVRKSDLGWILRRLSVIPEIKQPEVCKEYERLYLSDISKGRDLANTYLLKESKKYLDQ